MATSTFEKATDGLSNGLRDAGERIVDLKDDTARSLGTRVRKLGSLMKSHPLLTILIGLSAGYLLSRITRRG